MELIKCNNTVWEDYDVFSRKQAACLGWCNIIANKSKEFKVISYPMSEHAPVHHLYIGLFYKTGSLRGTQNIHKICNFLCIIELQKCRSSNKYLKDDRWWSSLYYCSIHVKKKKKKKGNGRKVSKAFTAVGLCERCRSFTQVHVLILISQGGL